MITIQFWNEDEIDQIEIPIKDADKYIELVKKHGYMDDDGTNYSFSRAEFDGARKIVIYIDAID